MHGEQQQVTWTSTLNAPPYQVELHLCEKFGCCKMYRNALLKQCTNVVVKSLELRTLAFKNLDRRDSDK